MDKMGSLVAVCVHDLKLQSRFSSKPEGVAKSSLILALEKTAPPGELELNNI